jgi:hypothetical protein
MAGGESRIKAAPGGTFGPAPSRYPTGLKDLLRGPKEASPERRPRYHVSAPGIFLRTAMRWIHMQRRTDLLERPTAEIPSPA